CALPIWVVASGIVRSAHLDRATYSGGAVPELHRSSLFAPMPQKPWRATKRCSRRSRRSATQSTPSQSSRWAVFWEDAPYKIAFRASDEVPRSPRRRTGLHQGVSLFAMLDQIEPALLHLGPDAQPDQGVDHLEQDVAADRGEGVGDQHRDDLSDDRLRVAFDQPQRLPFRNVPTGARGEHARQYRSARPADAVHTAGTQRVDVSSR